MELENTKLKQYDTIKKTSKHFCDQTTICIKWNKEILIKSFRNNKFIANYNVSWHRIFNNKRKTHTLKSMMNISTAKFDIFLMFYHCVKENVMNMVISDRPEYPDPHREEQLKNYSVRNVTLFSYSWHIEGIRNERTPI